MGDQMRRASLSVAANIAEGYGRYYYRERIRFCYLARGSLEELAALLEIAAELGFLPQEGAGRPTEKVRELRMSLNRYISLLRSRTRPPEGSHVARKTASPGRDLPD
jgi:four helix bundle protein